MNREELLKIFLHRADVKGPDDCWPWTGPIDTQTGYGRTSDLGRPTTAPQAAWVLSTGKDLPKRINGRVIVVRHLCSNRLCVNPNHLTLGTCTDNANDSYDLGIGIKLTIEDLKNIIILRKEGKTYREISKSFGTSEMVISNAINGRCRCYRLMLKKLNETV